MTTRKEGAGLRVLRTPNRTSLRAKILAYFAENPGSMLTRQEIMNRFDACKSGANSSALLLKRDGYVTALRGPGGVISYKAARLPDIQAPKPKRARPVRAWSHNSAYIEPKPMVNSVWELASTL